MPDVTVHRHGDRWSVVEAGAESALEEHPTREAAELAARHLAAGGRVEVVEHDPTGLEVSGEPGGADRGAAPGESADGMRDHDHVRTEQGGL